MIVAIREAALWYQNHLASEQPAKKRKVTSEASTAAPTDSPIDIVLLTDDAGNAREATALGLVAQKTRDYVASLSDDKAIVLGDLVAELSTGIDSTHLAGTEKSLSKQKTVYAPEYLPQSTIQAGIKEGKLHTGYFNLDPYNYREGSVKVHAYDKAILLVGTENMNRSVTGDMVVVEVLDESEWRAPTDEVMDEEGTSASFTMMACRSLNDPFQTKVFSMTTQMKKMKKQKQRMPKRTDVLNAKRSAKRPWLRRKSNPQAESLE